MTCPRCKQDNPVPDAQFCPRCGAPVKHAGDSHQLAASYADVQRSLTEALEQQTATSEILRIISSSPSDIKPVLDAVARSAMRLCESYDAMIMLREGEELHFAVHHGPIRGPVQFTGRAISRGWVAGRTVLDRQPVHVHDLATAGDEFPVGQADAVRAGYRTTLSVPLLREGEAIGVIHLRRSEVRPFTDNQIALLQTFADQAVIAIENVRLFTELEARNAELTEALDQQTATSEVLRVISSALTDVQPVFRAILERATRLCGADLGHLWLYDDDGMFRLAEWIGVQTQHLEWLRSRRHHFGRPFFREEGPWEAGQIEDVRATEPYRRGDEVWVRSVDDEGFRTLLNVPLVKEGRFIGALSIYRREVRRFAASQVNLVKTFADQAVIAIENVRLFTELGARNRDLSQAHSQVTEALERQTATSEILRVISGSPTNLQPVLDAVAERAARLCSADDVKIHLVDGDTLRLAARLGPIPSVETRPIIPTRHIGRAVLECRTIHIHDMQLALDEFPDAASDVRTFGARTSLATPLLREGRAIGVIQIRRLDVEPFSEKQIALLETFADQAVIAIENVRLFKELEARNRDLTTALDTQTATSDILRVISRSQTDVQPVFDAIVRSAVRLLGGHSGLLTR